MDFTIYDYIGFLGVFILIISVTKLNLVKNYSNYKEFYILNIIGSFLLLINDFDKESWFSFGVGVFWILISLVTILNKIVLPLRHLWILISVAVIYFFFGVVYSFNSNQEIEKALYSSLGMVSTCIGVVIYGLFSAKKISTLRYLVIGICVKFAVMLALLNDFNYASLSLQLYNLFITLIGIYIIIKESGDLKRREADID